MRTRQKSRDPRNPPTIVDHSWEARCTLYNCMPANNSTASVVDSRNDIPLDTATTNQCNMTIIMWIYVPDTIVALLLCLDNILWQLLQNCLLGSWNYCTLLGLVCIIWQILLQVPRSQSRVFRKVLTTTLWMFLDLTPLLRLVMNLIDIIYDTLCYCHMFVMLTP